MFPGLLRIFATGHSPFQRNLHSAVQYACCNCLMSHSSVFELFRPQQNMTDYWGTEGSPWSASPYEGDQGLSSDSLAAQISLATNAFISPEILDTISEYDGMDSPHLNRSENSGPRSYSAVSNREPPPPTGGVPFLSHH